MSEVKWIKICTDIFDDEKIRLIEAMPEADSIIVCWFKLLTHAGKQNNGGVFILNNNIPYTDEMLAAIFNRPLNTVRLALNTFIQFGMVEIVNDVYTITNWEKHQNEERLEKLREYQRNYKRKQRAAAALPANGECQDDCQVDSQVDVNATDKDIDLDKESDKEIKTKNKETKKESKSKGIFQEFAGDDTELMEALKEFNQMRTLIKHPMTDGAKKRLITKLQTFPRKDWLLILHQSIDHSWQDIYPLKEGDYNGTGRNKPVFGNGAKNSEDRFNIRYSNE